MQGAVARPKDFRPAAVKNQGGEEIDEGLVIPSSSSVCSGSRWVAREEKS
jgi:hypothetical protein